MKLTFDHNRIALACLALLLLLPANLPAKEVCIETTGEAVVRENDLPAAKSEAITRAKLNAVDDVVGVDLNARSIVQNSLLIDDSISKELKGSVTKARVLDEQRDGESFRVKVRVCVEPNSASDAVANLGMNSGVAVVVPVYRKGTTEKPEVMNTFSELINGSLAGQGYKVHDALSATKLTDREVEEALAGGSMHSVVRALSSGLSSTLLIGKIEYSESSAKGDDIGYGLRQAFTTLNVDFVYRLLAKDKDGKMVILASGVENVKGIGANSQDALGQGLRQLADKVIPSLSETLEKRIKGIRNRVTVTFEGLQSLGTNFSVKDRLQNVAFVTGVEEMQLGEFVVVYQENPIYLANSLTQLKEMKLLRYTPKHIVIKLVQ